MNLTSVRFRSEAVERSARRLSRSKRAFRKALERLEERTVLSGMNLVADEILVQFDPSANVQQRAQIRYNAGFGLDSEIDSPQRLNAGVGMMEVVKLPAGMSTDEAVAWLSRQPGVSFAEPNQWIAPQAISNDPYYTTSSRLWGMYGSDSPSAVGPSGTTNQYGSHAENAWNAGHTGSSSVFVGIIDEGVQITHPDLVNNMWVNPYDPPDGIDNDGNGFVDDTNGWDFINNDRTVYDGTADDHGTHVAGTIGADGGNGTGVVGVNWDVTMISAKFLGPSGGSLVNAVRAIDYVTDLKLRHGLNIAATNNSWYGGAYYYQSLHEAILRSAKADILFVAAASNNATNNDVTSSYPSNFSTLVGTSTESAATYEAVIAVASISSTGSLASTSGYGATTVDIGAPGVSINSTIPTGSYGSYSGTSMATPHVTGAIALLKSVYPNATAEQLRAAVLGSATPTASLAGKTVTGGRLNIFSAINHSTWTAPPQEPTVTVADAAKTEGAAGTSNLVFTVTLSNAFNQPVSMAYATQDASANAGSDYVAAAGTLTIPAGATTGTIAVAILGDYDIESNETFQVVLSSPSNATIADDTAIGTIVNDDAVPSISVTSKSQSEGNSGTPNMVFDVQLSNATGAPVTVNYSTADISATAGIDYLATTGTLTIPAGATSATIAVPIIGDTEIEANETFELQLTDPSANATIAAPLAVGTIVNDDAVAVNLSIADASVTEGDRNWRNMNFVVTLSAPASSNVTVFYATANGTASSSSDYEAKSGILTISAGQTSATITVRIRGDRTNEADESFYVNLTNPSQNAVISDGQAIGTIVDDDSSGNGSNNGNNGIRDDDSADAARSTSGSIGLIAAPIPELDYVLSGWNSISKKAARSI
jgi:subtilisin family serine protease